MDGAVPDLLANPKHQSSSRRRGWQARHVGLIPVTPPADPLVLDSDEAIVDAVETIAQDPLCRWSKSRWRAY